MSNPPVVLDTNVFNYPDIVRWLRDYRADKYLPAVAYMELAIVYYARDGSLIKLDSMLRSADIEKKDFDIHQAQTCALFIEEKRVHKDRWKDCMIAAYAVIRAA